MLNYLPGITPDYTDEILNIIPSGNLQISGDILQYENSTDGGNPKVVTMKETPELSTTLQFKALRESDRNTISDLYFNPAKAMKTARSFIWEHPDSKELYTAIFQSGYSETLYTYGLYDISVTIKIIGNYEA